MATTQFELVTPTRTLYSGQAEMIVCRSVDGEIAFLANHMPYIGALDIGVVRIVGPGGGRRDGASSEPEVRLAVHGGFVEVKDNQVIMLADAAELACRRSTCEAPAGPSARPAQPCVSQHRGQRRRRGRRRPALGPGPPGGRLRLTPASRRRRPPGLMGPTLDPPAADGCLLFDGERLRRPPPATSTAAPSARPRTEQGVERHTQGRDAERHVGDGPVGQLGYSTRPESSAVQVHRMSTGRVWP